MAKSIRSINFFIDRGGTFTDVCALVESKNNRELHTLKLLSVDAAYPDAPREGIRRILEKVTGKSHPADQPIDSSNLGWIRMGTTVATNALLERNGELTALVITKGFKDLLRIGNQSRPEIFDLEIKRPDVLFSSVIEADERVRIAKWESEKNSMKLVTGTTEEELIVEKELDSNEIRQALQEVRDRGIKSLAVCLMHSYTFREHEQQIKKIAEELGFTNVSLSSDLMPMVKIVSRGHTTCADAYLTPCIKEYVDQFVSGFDDEFNKRVKLTFMQSDGGLCSMNNFCGFRAILSGPAGGVVGFSKTTTAEMGDTAIIGFDMGGTSTDVSRFSGTYEHVFENTTAGVTIQAPQLDINTVAAGGGSRLFFRAGMFQVGPESARAEPGPVCYRKPGGVLAITDANLMLGRIVPKFFPHIFGENRDQPLSTEDTRKAFLKLTDEINEYNKEHNIGQELSPEEVAFGFVRVANESMCRPIRALTMAKGYDTTRHVLACFGGAGGQHCCAIARSLGIKSAFVHRYSGVLSAYGMGMADVVHEEQEACAKYLTSDNFDFIKSRVAHLDSTCRNELESQEFTPEAVSCTPFLNLRYDGTDTALMIAGPTRTSNYVGDEANVFEEYEKKFVERYKREFGFTLDRTIKVDDIRCRGVAENVTFEDLEIDSRNTDKLEPKTTVTCHFEHNNQLEAFDTGVYFLNELKGGDVIDGPAMILNDTSTILIEPDCIANITPHGNIKIKIGLANENTVSTALDRIQLSIFAHRFMSIAEQMGYTLQRTSISTNIKERLDFSCALFDPKGGLVANAPHLPVHLGSMQEAVRYQIEANVGNIYPGDVFVANHPAAGGTHLPDITVITPVFVEGTDEPIFWAASRGHHADIGGIAPGSMPPFSKFLSEEGAPIMSHKLVSNNKFDEEGITKILTQSINGSPGTRNLSDNLSDLKAQVAANNKGIQLTQSLVEEYSVEVVQAYMQYIQDNAEESVRAMLKDVAKQYNLGPPYQYTVRLWNVDSRLSAKDVRNYLEDSDLENYRMKYNRRRGVAYVKFTTIDDADDCVKKLNNQRWGKNHVGAVYDETNPYYNTDEPESLPEERALYAEDAMDDGSPICLKVSIDPATGDAHFDFTGTGPMVYGNCNAPPAVSYSAIIYGLRCMVDTDIPLNQGCLKPIKVTIPENTILNPSIECAVVGGNVLTSQRVTDVVFKAFQACAASQGCMNNLTFGDDTFGYYETICGGHGAGPTWHGKSCVHTHMTNTRITDPEILESRYPVILREFGERVGTGGRGQYNGGNGCIRRIEFCRDLEVGILSERRAKQPYGLQGGEDGKCGMNLIHTAKGSTVNIGPKTQYSAKKGDAIEILSPGGGAYGAVDDGSKDESKEKRRLNLTGGSVHARKLAMHSA